MSRVQVLGLLLAIATAIIVALVAGYLGYRAEQNVHRAMLIAASAAGTVMFLYFAGIQAYR